MATVEFQQPEPLPLSDIPTAFPMDPDVCEEEEDDDIYRGLPEDQFPPAVITVPSPPPRPESSASGSSSSSSSRYSVSGRLGALAAVVEQAITRWARRNSSSSSLTTSTSSSSSASRSALSVQTKSTRKRRRRYNADHNARSERDIIARLRARHETRRIPRGFSLYVPPQLRSSRPNATPSNLVLQYDEQGVLKTHLLPVILNGVQCALRSSEKLRHYGKVLRKDEAPPIEEAIDGVSPSPPVDHGYRRRAGKGKQRITNKTPREHIPRPVSDGVVGPEKGSWPSWWLDISSPTYTDMRALGKVPLMLCTTIALYPHILQLLHLHPLTLEDILHQDPREKMVHPSPFSPSPSLLTVLLGTVSEAWILLHSVQSH